MLKINVAKRRGKAKTKVEDKRQAVTKKIADSYSEEFDVKMALIQELIPLGLREVTIELQQEVTRLAGRKHERGGDQMRWGKQNGSVYLRDQKFPIKVPRVRDTSMNQEVVLQTYQRLQKPFADDEGTVLKLLHGLSTHRYEQSSSLAAETLGLSASNLSRRFKKKTGTVLRRFQNRSLRNHEIVCVFVDGKRYADDGLMVAMGITMEGRKVFLGVEHIHSENSKAIGQWFEKLVGRGLRFEEGILFVIDGSKGIEKAIKRYFADYAFIQRCQWHKCENVTAYLDEMHKELCRRRMREAHAKTTHKEAKEELEKLHTELLDVTVSAANSLMEGLEETLTLHQLGLAPELARSLSTTNCIESVMSQLGQYTDKVDRWHNSDQILRWSVAALTDLEPRLRRIRGFRYLNVLRFKMQEIIKQRVKKHSPASLPTSQSMPDAEIVECEAK
jgi:putative transposase